MKTEIELCRKCPNCILHNFDNMSCGMCSLVPQSNILFEIEFVADIELKSAKVIYRDKGGIEVPTDCNYILEYMFKNKT